MEIENFLPLQQVHNKSTIVRAFSWNYCSLVVEWFPYKTKVKPQQGDNFCNKYTTRPQPYGNQA